MTSLTEPGWSSFEFHPGFTTLFIYFCISAPIGKRKTFSFVRMNITVVPHKYTPRRFLLLVTGALIMALLFSCNTVKKVQKGEHLLTHNHVIYRFGSTQKNKGIATDITDIGKEGIEKFEVPQRVNAAAVLPYVKQKPNTRIFFIFPFYLYLYDLPDSVNTATAKARRDSAYILKARKKGWKDEKLKRKMARRTGREWIMSQGEPPVIFDSSLTQRSTEQVRTFLFNKGYFDAEVKDSIHLSDQKANVFYIVKLGKPYKIRNVQYAFEDLGLATEILSDTANCKIKKKDVYDKDIIDAESDRITTELNNAGYFYFTKQYVSYTLDTNSKSHFINVTINIKKFVQRDRFNRDSTIETNHIAYHIRHVIIQMNYDPTKIGFYNPTDSILYNGILIVSPGELLLKPKILQPKIFVNPGDLYRVENRENTYAGLAQLNEFSYVSVKYIPVADSNYLDCYIQLMPVVKHSVGAEFEGTNTGGDLGVAGDLSYANYNQFDGAEKLQFKINGGLIAQEVFSSGNSNTLLNTEDLGPELDLFIPRPLFPYNSLLQLFPLNLINYTNPQTSLKLTFDYQLRLDDYVRHVLGLSYGLDFSSKNKKSHFTLALFEWNLVNAYLTPYFIQQLDNYNLFFQNSFQNQVITDGRFSWTYTTQNSLKKRTHFMYLKPDIEWSGLVFDAAKHLLNLPLESGSYYIQQFNSPYSQYIKLDADFRQYFLQGKKQTYVLRFFGGYGLPYANSTGLPYTKSFWAGGSNDIRAWPIQELGPGGSPASLVAGQVGEIKLEGNFEYRVKLVKYFDFAWFIDAGNIWLIKSVANQGIQRAYMETSGPDPFWDEIAIGTGPGFRFDFDYFIVRFDLGEPIRDPSLSPGHRILSLDRSIHRTVLNIGIGYPF